MKIFYLFALLPLTAAAGNITCESPGTTRCFCPANLNAKCEGFDRDVHLANGQPVESAKFSVTLDSGEEMDLVLDKPKSPVRKLYNARENDEVLAALKKQGIEGKVKYLNLSSFQVNDKAIFYAETGGMDDKLEDLERVKNRFQKAEGGCNWKGTPGLLKTPKGNFCYGTVTCWDGASIEAGCEAHGPKQAYCPPSYQCMESPVEVDVPPGTRRVGPRNVKEKEAFIKSAN